MNEHPRPWTARFTSAGICLYDAKGEAICHDWDADDDVVDYILLCINTHTELLTALKNLVTFFDVHPDSKLPDTIKAQWRNLCRRDPHCQQALAAIAKAEPHA